MLMDGEEGTLGIAYLPTLHGKFKVDKILKGVKNKIFRSVINNNMKVFQLEILNYAPSFKGLRDVAIEKIHSS